MDLQFLDVMKVEGCRRGVQMLYWMAVRSSPGVNGVADLVKLSRSCILRTIKMSRQLCLVKPFGQSMW